MTTNANRLGLSHDKCRNQIERILLARKCVCPAYKSHTCYLRNCWQTPSSFVDILRDSFQLNFEGMADALHHNPSFHKWCSEFEQDSCFGAKFDFFNTSLEGENVFVNPPFNNIGTQPDILMKVIDRCLSLSQSNKPTRCVVVIPVFSGQNGDRFLRKALQLPSASIIARFPSGTFAFDPPDSYRLRPFVRPFSHSICIILICSRTSLLVDPINWQVWQSKLRGWAASRNVGVETPHHPLDQSICSRTQPRALEIRSSLGDPRLCVMPWVVKSRIRNCKPTFPASANSGFLLELWKGNWLLQAVGILPQNFVGEDRSVKLRRWGSSFLWRSFAIWKLRCKLEREKQKILKQKNTQCPSPYHFAHLPNNAELLPCGCGNWRKVYTQVAQTQKGAKRRAPNMVLRRSERIKARS